MKSVRTKIVKAAGLLMVLQVFDQITGLLKQMVIAAHFGASETMDSYLVATTVVGLILLWVGLPIRQTLIPMFRYDLTQRGERAAWANTSVLFNDLLLVLIFIVLAGELLAPQLVGILAPGFSEQASASATSLARVLLITVVLLGMGNVLSQIFYSYERFFRPGVVGSVNNIVTMVALLGLGSTYGILGLAIAAVLGAVCQFMLQLPILWEKRKFYSRRVDFRDSQLAQMGNLSFPLLISTGGNEVARVTDRIFASLLPGGSLSALAFAHRPTSVVIEFLIRPLQQATFPHFTKLAAERDFPTLSRQLFDYLRLVLFIALPATVGLMFTAEPIVQVLYQRGAFDQTAVHLTSQALLFYALGVPANVVVRVFRNTFFGLKDTWTPTKVALISIAIKIALTWVLIPHFSHLSIALADSVAQFTNALALFVLLPTAVKGQEGAKTCTALARILSGCVVMGGLLYLTKEKIAGMFAPFLELALLIALGIGAYGLLALFLRMEPGRLVLDTMTQMATRYFFKRSKTTHA